MSKDNYTIFIILRYSTLFKSAFTSGDWHLQSWQNVPQVFGCQSLLRAPQPWVRRWNTRQVIETSGEDFKQTRWFTVGATTWHKEMWVYWLMFLWDKILIHILHDYLVLFFHFGISLLATLDVCLVHINRKKFHKSCEGPGGPKCKG